MQREVRLWRLGSQRLSTAEARDGALGAGPEHPCAAVALRDLEVGVARVTLDDFAAFWHVWCMRAFAVKLGCADATPQVTSAKNCRIGAVQKG